MKEKNNSLVISINCDVIRPPRWSDLTQLDDFLWGYVESKTYKNNPQSIPWLNYEIIRVKH